MAFLQNQIAFLFVHYSSPSFIQYIMSKSSNVM